MSYSDPAAWSAPPFDQEPGWAPSGGRRSRRVTAAGVAALMLVSGGLGAGAAAAFRDSSTTPRSFQLPAQQDPGLLAPSPASPPTTTANTAAVAAKVIPAVVDVNTRLSQGGQAAGTGMVLSSSGEILTNNHVIEDATQIRVQVAGTGPSYSAHVVGYDKTDDVALLQAEGAPSLTTVRTGSSAALNVGDAVIAIGNALGRGGTPAVTQGVVTGLNQSVTAGDAIGPSNSLTGMIAMSAPLQEGDSGGPVVDTTGAVVGMNTAAAGGGRRSSSSVAFAVPIDRALSVVNQIRSGQGSATVHIGGKRALLGVVLQDASSGFGGGSRSTGPGAAVSSVQPGGPAADAGIDDGSTIVELGGTAINQASDLTAALGRYRPGDKVSVSWLDSSGRRHTATVQLTEGPPS